MKVVRPVTSSSGEPYEKIDIFCCPLQASIRKGCHFLWTTTNKRHRDPRWRKISSSATSLNSVSIRKTTTETLGFLLNGTPTSPRVQRQPEWANQGSNVKSAIGQTSPILESLKFLAKHRVTTLPLPVLSRSYRTFFFFLGTSGTLRATDVENVKEFVTASLKRIPESKFQKAFVRWVSRYTRCVGAHGCYYKSSKYFCRRWNAFALYLF